MFQRQPSDVWYSACGQFKCSNRQLRPILSTFRGRRCMHQRSDKVCAARCRRTMCVLFVLAGDQAGRRLVEEKRFSRKGDCIDQVLKTTRIRLLMYAAAVEVVMYVTTLQFVDLYTYIFRSNGGTTFGSFTPSSRRLATIGVRPGEGCVKVGIHSWLTITARRLQVHTGRALFWVVSRCRLLVTCTFSHHNEILRIRDGARHTFSGPV